MSRVTPNVLEEALHASIDPFAAELLTRLRRGDPPPPAKATRPFPLAAALEIYRRKASRGDRPAVRTEGYPALLAALVSAPEGDVVVHGVTFPDAVYLVFTDPDRRHCLAVLRKRRLPAP